MIDKELIDRRRKEIAEIRHADSVFRDIKARENERETYEKRWFWELLQNAKDSVTESDKISIKIETNDEEIVFSHTGNPFELDDILSLIIQGSSKNNQEGKTGRFGTGFMTTYLLSKEVEITGKLSNNQGCFKFTLNRNGKLNDEFYKNQLDSNLAFDNSITETSYQGDSDFQTIFRYKLNDIGLETAAAGLQSLNELIPITQLFNSQIDSIILFKNSENITYKKQFITSSNILNSKIEEWELETIINENTIKKLTAYVIFESDFEICLITEIIAETEHLYNLTHYPKLYFTFPLIGTEDIGIPFIINSSKFEPRVERDGIYLNKINVETSTAINKEIIDKALKKATLVFSEIINNKRIRKEYYLFNYKASKDYNWVDNTWFNNLKKEIFEIASDIPFIPIYNDVYTTNKLNNIKIPYQYNSNPNQSFWQLLSAINEFSIPHLDEIKYWIEVLQNYAAILNQEIFQIKPIYGPKSLISYVENKIELNDLESKISIDVFLWLNDFYNLIYTSYDTFPLDKRIFLNQNKIFRIGQGMLWDHCKDDKILAISNLLQSKFSSKLISNDVTPFHVAGIENFKTKDAIENLKQELNNQTKQSFLQQDIQQASAMYVHWLIKNNFIDVLKDLKVLSGTIINEDDNSVYEIFPKGKHLLLPPKIFFENNFPLYSKLIREKDCMHVIYNNYLDENDYTYLDTNGLIHKSPLVIRKEKVDLKTFDTLLMNIDDLPYLKDLEGKLIQPIELEYSDFAYLTNTDGHIYDRNATPKATLERFKFLFLEASEKDMFFESDFQEVEIGESKRKVIFHKALWLLRAKKLQWINVKNEDDTNEKKSLTETPSSKNLSELIKNEEALIKAIRGSKQQLFLSKLGVSVSDLIRNTLPSDELKDSWDKAITNMITSDADPELVQAIFNDPLIKEEYKKRINERNLIARNQKIGNLIEQLFKELINKLIESGSQIEIQREPFGSDFLLTEESSDLINDQGEREGFKINQWLVELKATGKEYAAMTPLQAETAYKHKEAYALIVVPLDGTNPDLEYVKTNARVINFIGFRMEALLIDFNDVKSKKQDLLSGVDGISVQIDDQNTRFNVNNSIWKLPEVETIENFISTKFNSPTR